MIYLKTDGRIEFTLSGCCCPPDKRREGLHTRGFTSWFKVDNGEWRSAREGMVLRDVIREAKTVAEFLETYGSL